MAPFGKGYGDAIERFTRHGGAGGVDSYLRHREQVGHLEAVAAGHGRVKRAVLPVVGQGAFALRVGLYGAYGAAQGVHSLAVICLGVGIVGI